MVENVLELLALCLLEYRERQLAIDSPALNTAFCLLPSLGVQTGVAAEIVCLRRECEAASGVGYDVLNAQETILLDRKKVMLLPTAQVAEDLDVLGVSALSDEANPRRASPWDDSAAARGA